MQASNIRPWSPRRVGLLIAGILGLWVAASGPEDHFDFADFIDPISGIIVFFPILVLVITIRRRERVGQILFLTGIPLGLMGILIGDQQVLANASGGLLDPDIMAAVVGVLLLPGVYGVMASTLGYLLSREGRGESFGFDVHGPKPSSFKRLIPPGAYGPIVALAFLIGSNISDVFDVTATGLIAFFLFSFLAFARPLNRATASMSAFAMAGITSLIGLLSWYGSGIGAAWVASMIISGPVIGLFIYLLLLFDWLLVGGDEDFDAARMNWHWVELVSFLTFMLFSPATFLERVAEGWEQGLPPAAENKSP